MSSYYRIALLRYPCWMLNERPISNGTILIICRFLGVISLLLNIIALYLIGKTWIIVSRSIFTVLLLLQANCNADMQEQVAFQMLYTLQNFHFTVLFIPFFYIMQGGGYCIGSLCEPHYVSFSANLVRGGVLALLTVYTSDIWNIHGCQPLWAFYSFIVSSSSKFIGGVVSYEIPQYASEGWLYRSLSFLRILFL